MKELILQLAEKYKESYDMFDLDERRYIGIGENSGKTFTIEELFDLYLNTKK